MDFSLNRTLYSNYSCHSAVRPRRPKVVSSMHITHRLRLAAEAHLVLYGHKADLHRERLGTGLGWLGSS